ncbi:MAG TPA: hypothetical protein VN912_05685, partial [Candidatus Angelobacter sp.]|nr:hypothetical protein [Candidatus Angelobacter sp.]
WSDATSSVWCAASGQPLTACVPPTPVADANGNPVSQPPPQLTNPDAMAAALAASNPYVATLVAALESGTQWVQSPVQGLIHDSSYDPTLTQVTFTAALPFAAQVTTDNLGGAQLSITVTGDITQLVNLQQYASSTTPAAVPPQSVQGSITSGGLHGSLQVTAASGAIQAIQW